MLVNIYDEKLCKSRHRNCKHITHFRKLLTMSKFICMLSFTGSNSSYNFFYLIFLFFSNRHPVDDSHLSFLPFKSSRCQLKGHVFLSSFHFWPSFSCLVVGANTAIGMVVASLILFSKVMHLCCPRDTVCKT